MIDARLEPCPGTAGAAVVLPPGQRVDVGDALDAAEWARDATSARPRCVLAHDGHRWAVIEASDTVRLNGAPLTGATWLRDRDVLALAAAWQWEFVSGEARTAELPTASPPATRATAARSSPRRAFPTPRRAIPWRAVSVVAVALLLAGIAGVALWHTRGPASASAALLSDRQAARFDSLLVVAYDHLERGYSLLELGAPADAAREFARGINTLALSDLRAHPQVKPRIEALESSVAAIYRARRLAVPPAYAQAQRRMSAEVLRPATLSREQFSHAFDLVSAAFRLRYHKPIVVVGRDHPEHLALYGPGGALDLRTITMTPEQVAFVIAQCRAYGIRVKDFSQDAILRQQVQAAIRAGLADRAGTGLHLHVDRFADRRDRWTVTDGP